MDPTGRRHAQIAILPYMSCQRQILGMIKWQDHVKNVDIVDRTGLSSIAESARGAKHCLVT